MRSGSALSGRSQCSRALPERERRCGFGGGFMESRLRSKRAVRLALALAVITLVSQGCDVEVGRPTRAPDHPVEVVGVVASESVGGQRSVTDVYVTFDDGRKFTYNTDYQV